MCGIAGLWNLKDDVSRVELQRFNDMVSHRGPDGGEIFIDRNARVGLGHRRLAIIDTSDSGRQPMSFGDGRYWIVFNGEIYNFVELRSELRSYGYRFLTESDTEVVIASYDKWGEECQLHFNGMWAFCIWDARERKLFLSRDRFGVKPLLYHFSKGRFAFASEMKAFLALDDFVPEFDASMISASLEDPSLVEGSENCLLRGVKRLQGGHSLTLNQSWDLKIQRWWNTLDHLETPPAAYDGQVEHYRELFLDACRIRMRSDVPIGTALSGGLDSSSVLSSMSYIRGSGDTTERMALEWQKAFIGTYPGKEIDERMYADEVIRHTGVQPVYCEMNSDMYLDHYQDILYQYEELSDIHLGPWFVHKQQRMHGVVVTIDGHGGDEALGGYTWHALAAMKDAGPVRFAELAMIRKNMNLSQNAGAYLGFLKRLGGRLAGKKVKKPSSGWMATAALPFYSPAMEADALRLKGRDALFVQLYTDFHFTHLPMNLRDFDRLSMAHGVEVRSPFMDWRLVCYTFSLPSEAKIGAGFTKRVLRDAMKGILPEKIRTRTKKLGFPNLDDAWMSPRSQEFIRDSLGMMEFQSSSFWNASTVRRDMEEAFNVQDREKIYAAWKLLQAFYLIRAFEAVGAKGGKK